LPEPVSLEPVILQSPNTLGLSVTESAEFRVIAVGQGPLRYQWQLNQRPLLGATNAELSLTNLTAAEAGDYTVRLTDVVGVATTESARLSVAPLITSHQASQRVGIGDAVTFRVEAVGAMPLRYAWFHDAALLEGGTNAVLMILNVQPADAGFYGVQVTHETSVGEVTSGSRLGELAVGP
jgi:hypothetical protein